MANDDKYPVESDRRRFVKGVVGGAAISGALATGAVTVTSTTTPTGGGGGIMNYFGANRTLGPAPRGLPQIPMEITDDGELAGVWPEPESETLGDGTEFVRSAAEIGGVEYTTEWFQYCGLQTFEGIVPDNTDEDALFRYDAGVYDWMDEVDGGDVMLTEHFEDYDDWTTQIGDPDQGKPATGTWRSEEVPAEETIPILVIKTDQLDFDAMDERTRDWMEAACPEDEDGGRYIAYVYKCTHFCCVPGYRSLAGAPDFGADNKIYCNCHNSVYDPFDIVEDQFPSLPRPEDS